MIKSVTKIQSTVLLTSLSLHVLYVIVTLSFHQTNMKTMNSVTLITNHSE